MSHHRYRNDSVTVVETPLFERIENSDYAELQDNRKMKEALQQKVSDLEKIIVDLERRLEEEAKLCVQVEKESTEIERAWKAKCAAMEQDVEEWKKKCHQQELKGDRLREHLSRTERELYGLLQRKYQIMRGPSNVAGAGPSGRQNQSNSKSGGYLLDDSNSPPASAQQPLSNPVDELIVPPQSKEIYQRRVLVNLSDFFGL